MIIGHYVPEFFSAGGIQSYVRRIVEGQRRRGNHLHPTTSTCCVRPHRLVENFQRAEQERKFLAHCHTTAISQFTKAQMVRSGHNSAAILIVHNPAPAVRSEADIAAPAFPGPPRRLR